MAAPVACLKSHIPEPYPFLNKLRPIVHIDLPSEHGNDDGPAPRNKALWVHVLGEQQLYLDNLFAEGGRWVMPLQKSGVVSFECVVQLLKEAMFKEVVRHQIYDTIFQQTLELDQKVRTCDSRRE